MTDKIKDLMDEAEDALFQKIIDRQEGVQGITENTLPAPGPTEAELKKWTQALDALSRQAPPPRKRGRLRRTVILAALLGALLLAAAGAFHRQILNWIETAHEQYTQLQATSAAKELVDGWAQVYSPTYFPQDFSISDAASTDSFQIIEYANTEGDRITFYQYMPSSNVRIDTELADKTISPWVDATTAYHFQKGELSTLYWSQWDYIFSIEYNPSLVPETEIKALAESIRWKQ